MLRNLPYDIIGEIFKYLNPKWLSRIIYLSSSKQPEIAKIARREKKQQYEIALSAYLESIDKDFIDKRINPTIHPKLKKFHYFHNKVPLIIAIKLDSIRCLEQCLNKGADINQHQINNNYTGYTPLFESIKIGNLELIKNIISKGANLNHTDNKGNNILHIAVIYNQVDIFSYLIKYPSVYPLSTQVNSFGISPLTYAYQINNSKYINIYHNAGPAIFNDYNIDNYWQRKFLPIKKHATRQNIESEIESFKYETHIKKAILSNDLDKIVFFCKIFKSSTLYQFFSIGVASINEDIYRKFYNLSEIGLLGIKSCSFGQTNVLRFFLPNTEDFHNTPIHYAVKVGSHEILIYLFQFIEEHKLKLNSSNIDCIKSAIANLANDEGNTPLHVAALKNDVKMVKILIEAGARESIIIKNKKGLTPLDIAYNDNRPPQWRNKTRHGIQVGAIRLKIYNYLVEVLEKHNQRPQSEENHNSHFNL